MTQLNPGCAKRRYLPSLSTSPLCVGRTILTPVRKMTTGTTTTKNSAYTIGSWILLSNQSVKRLHSTTMVFHPCQRASLFAVSSRCRFTRNLVWRPLLILGLVVVLLLVLVLSLSLDSPFGSCAGSAFFTFGSALGGSAVPPAFLGLGSTFRSGFGASGLFGGAWSLPSLSINCPTIGDRRKLHFGRFGYLAGFSVAAGGAWVSSCCRSPRNF